MFLDNLFSFGLWLRRKKLKDLVEFLAVKTMLVTLMAVYFFVKLILGGILVKWMQLLADKS